MVAPQAILQAIQQKLKPTDDTTYAGTPTIYNTDNPAGPPDPLVVLTNNVRAQNNLGPLKENYRLINSATDTANTEAGNDYWSHNYNGITPWDRMDKAGYKYHYAGENLARGYNSDQEAMNALMNSPEHRDNILDPNYTEMGVARQTDQNGHTYVVTHFGKPW